MGEIDAVSNKTQKGDIQSMILFYLIYTYMCIGSYTRFIGCDLSVTLNRLNKDLYVVSFKSWGLSVVELTGL